jgi:anaerobic selenocysteine-containing dehydrogenase
MKSEHEIFCFLCTNHCSLIATVEDGKMIKARPDKKSGLPCDICPDAKGPITIPETFNHPERLKYPMKKAGKKGENRWTRITWDEALDIIAERLITYRDKFGPESIAMVLGEPKGMEFAFGQRFGTYLKTPNVITPGNYCGVQTGSADLFTFGTMMVQSDLEGDAKCAIIWGANPLNTGGTFRGIRPKKLNDALNAGCKLIMVEPGKTEYCSRADYWLRLKPGSDGALAMGMIKVIIDEELYDKGHVENFTVGFDELKKETATFSLEEVEKETWIPPETIEAVARTYATNKPGQILWGNAIENSVCALQACRAITILRGLTGNLGIRGGEVILSPAKYYRPGKFFLSKDFPRPIDISIGRDFPIAMGSAYVPTQSLVKAILTEQPYPIKMGLAHVTNPILTYPDSLETYEAFMKLNFLVVAEIFPTAFTAIADLVLPAALPLEHDTIGYWPSWYGYVRAYPKVVDPPKEAWPDAKMLNELAKRVGLGEYFWEDWRESLDVMMAPSGMTYDEFVQKRMLYPTKFYLEGSEDKYFRTPSGKIELYSKQMKQLGLSPIPCFKEVTKSRFDGVDFEKFPLYLTNAKETAYMLSGYRHIDGMRKRRAEAMVELHPDTARKYGLKEGDMVFIETVKGRIQQRLKLADHLAPRTVMAAFGWSFPEEENNQYGWRKANLNILSDNDPPYDPTTGSVQLRGIPCRVYSE